MANDVKLEVYTLKVRNKGNKKAHLPLENFSGKNDFLGFFQEYINSFDHQLEINDSQKKSLKLDSESLSFNSGNRTISGIIESGDYGFASTGYNIETGKVSYERSVDDTEIKPFYFLLYMPKGKGIGYVLLQRLGVYGIHSIFKNHLNGFFESRFADLKLDLDQFVSKELARTFVEKGAIKEIILIKNKVPTDIADKLQMQGYSKEIKSIEFRVKGKSRLPFNQSAAKYMADPNAEFFEIPELEEIGFDYSTKIKVKSKFNGNTRTIDLSETGQIRPYYDIDSDIDKSEDGHPVFESIDKVAKGLVVELTS